MRKLIYNLVKKPSVSSLINKCHFFFRVRYNRETSKYVLKIVVSSKSADFLESCIKSFRELSDKTVMRVVEKSYVAGLYSMTVIFNEQ